MDAGRWTLDEDWSQKLTLEPMAQVSLKYIYIYWSNSTFDGSKIGRVFAVARERLLRL